VLRDVGILREFEILPRLARVTGAAKALEELVGNACNFGSFEQLAQ
jgi:hypothetical protein